MTDLRIEEQIREDAEALEQDWDTNPRWHGIERHYSAEDVIKLRGSFRVEHSVARAGAERLWRLVHEEDFVAALGALTGGQAVEMVKAGLQAIYLSGWQVAADANLASHTYPDQSLYPANSVPAVVRRINNALQRADQIAWAEGTPAHTMAPIVADAEAGFGGTLNVFELMKSMIEAGAAGVHFEDQLASEKKCGHLGGKVLVPTDQFVRTLTAARLAADVLGIPSLVVARTDALGATLLTSDIDERDRRFTTGERTHEGFYYVRNGIDAAIARAQAYAPYADMIWCETATPDLEEARIFAEGVHALYPEKLLAYNCSPQLQLEGAPGRLDDRAVPEGAGRDGLQVPVHHPRGVPRAQREHVRARQGVRHRRDDGLRPAPGARVRDGDRRLHGDAPPGRGRHRLLRQGLRGDLGRQLVDARAEGLDRRGAVQGVTPRPEAGGAVSPGRS